MEKPKIRFLKNKHSWVRNRFEEIAKRRTKSSDNPDLPRIEYQDIISGEGRLNKDLNKNIDCRKGIVFETNDILYGKLRPYLKNWLHPNFNGIALGDFWVLQARNCDSKFLFSLVQSPKFQRIANDTSGTKMPRSDWKTVSQTEFSIPSSNEEQSAIGSLFRTLDDLLASYKDNLVNYQSLKATMLAKMFPKAGQTVPEIRLDGFDGEWENKILSEVTNITMGQSPKSENYTDNPNDYILVQGNADIKDKQVVPRLWTTEVTKMAEIGDIILTVRAPVGDIGKTDFNVVIGRGVAAIKGNDFIFYTLEKMKMTGFWNRFSTGSTFESISSNDIKEAIIQLPTLEEQQAIGTYFSNLDNLIAAHQEKISQLETLKKKLLQDMFI
uniref:restriction endonuclease subunit S n=1 Tax=uncultured Streptococcus sp. TaxID=83427 RepID=UPI0025F2C23E|nr:restriction endonuclease subunit S [uncultured Streptococcus sp.]